MIGLGIQRVFGGWRIVAAWASLLVCGAEGAAPGADRPVDRFLAFVESDASIPAESRRLVRSAWDKCGECDPAEFLTQGLAVLSPKFREGLDAYDADDFAKCAAIMEEARTDKNRFVAVHAAVYEVKAMVSLEQFLDAGERLALLTTESHKSEASSAQDVAAYSYFSAEVEFLRGAALLADLQYKKAAMVLQRMLQDYPDASPRLTVAAQQMLTELSHRQAEDIGEVVDLMTYSSRRLQHGDSDETLQQKQKRIIELLETLEDEAKKREQSSKGGGGGGGGSGNQGGQSPNSPMQDSMLPGGQAREGDLREAQRAAPGEAWGAMPPADRERVLQALRESFPARYRQLVEQYYEELAKKP